MIINQGINRRNNNIINQGFVDSIKSEGNMRFLALNSRGFGPNNKEKINMIK